MWIQTFPSSNHNLAKCSYSSFLIAVALEDVLPINLMAEQSLQFYGKTFSNYCSIGSVSQQLLKSIRAKHLKLINQFAVHIAAYLLRD
jgi:hypothetical protein